MSQYPRVTLSGGNQYPAIATSVPSQYPVVELVDGQGNTVTNVGNGPADGMWTNVTLVGGWTAGDVTPQYMKDSRGNVFFRGKVIVPEAGGGSVFTTMPAGHRVLAGAYYIDVWGGGTPANPSTAALVSADGTIISGYTNGGGAAAAGVIVDLRRIMYPTT